MSSTISNNDLSIILTAAPDFKRLKVAGSLDKAWRETLWLFLHVLYQQGFVLSFDWQAEFAGKEKDLADVDALRVMSLEGVRKVLTAHVRMDRLCEGHLNSIAESGYLEQLVERLNVLRS